MDANKPHVLIVGAGPTGLFLAQALKHLNVEFTIFERDSNIVGRGHGADWGMGIYWSRPLLEQILSPELFSRLREATADPTLDPTDEKTRVIPLHNGDTGDWIHDVKLDWLMRLTRSKIRRLLSEDLDIQWGKFLDRVDMSDDGKFVTAIFRDGSSATGTMMVGCDGGRSIVREHAISGARSTNAPFVGVRSVFKLRSDEQALRARSISPVTFMTIHPEGVWSLLIVLDVPDNSNPKEWTFQTLTSWAADESTPVDDTGRFPDVTIEELKERQRIHGGVMGDIYRWSHELPPDDISHNQIRIGSWLTKEWNSFGGRLVLCGDAAHPMPFHRGQGLNNAIADLALLVDAIRKAELDGGDLKEEVEKCNRDIVQRGFKAVSEARVNCKMVHSWDTFRQSDLVAKGPMRV